MDKKIEYALMAKDTEEKAVAPADVSVMELKGWNVVGTAEVDDEGELKAVTGRVIETPAHVIETTDHFLKVIPKFDDPLPVPVVMPLAAPVQAAKK